jgi:hypothetical protein
VIIRSFNFRSRCATASNWASAPADRVALRCEARAELVERELARRTPADRLPRLEELELERLLVPERGFERAPDLDPEPPLLG